jgi:glycosyltransferase involved in cell wall biosynthesis
MKVLVYAAGIHRGGGPVNHLRKFLTTLSNVESRHQWTFIINSDFEIPPGIDPAIAITPLRVRGSLDRLYQDFWRQRAEVRHSDADILLNLADFGPLPRDLRVVTFQRNPHYFDSDLLELRTGRGAGQNRLNWELRRQLAHWVVRRSDRVLCPSQTMAEVVATAVGVNGDRVHVLHHPFDVGSPSVPWVPPRPSRLLYVGHLMPHKNHEWLLRVFAASGLVGDGAELRMTAAREDWPEGYDSLLRVAREEGIGDAVRLLGRVPPEEVAGLYRTSTLFVFASRGESFGFPLVEALAGGVPTLALDTPIAREICGTAARYLPLDVDAAAAAVRTAACGDVSELQHWSRLARARATEFCLSWPGWLGRLEGELEAVHDSRS